MISLILAIVALVLFAIAQIQANGRSLVAWGGIALALIPLLAGMAEL
jgi:drug/metabolite transporter superfamily protein YnfA